MVSCSIICMFDRDLLHKQLAFSLTIVSHSLKTFLICVNCVNWLTMYATPWETILDINLQLRPFKLNESTKVFGQHWFFNAQVPLEWVLIKTKTILLVHWFTGTAIKVPIGSNWPSVLDLVGNEHFEKEIIPFHFPRYFGVWLCQL